MATRLTAFSLVICAFISLASAQLSTEEAKKKLAEKQAARQTDREKVISIKQGDLDDLRAEVAALKAQLAKFQGQPAAAVQAAKKIEPVRALAIGETREQVFDFLRRHPQDYEITADTISTPQVNSQTVVRQVDRQGQNTIDGKTALNIAANQSQQERLQQQVITEGQKNEKLILTRKENLPVEVGTHSDYNGVNTTTVHDFRKMWVPVEKILIEIVADNVTTLDREGLNASVEQSKMRAGVRSR